MLIFPDTPRYAESVTANSVTGFGDPNESRRTSAHHEAGAFFTPGLHVYGGCAWETFGSAGFLDSRFANPRTVTPINCLATVGDGSKNQGDLPMHFPTLNPSKARAAYHRACAKAALFADSSLSVRVKRYNAHMEKARLLEAKEVRS